MLIQKGNAVDLIQTFDKDIDLIVTDPPYAFGGSGAEHELSATVAVALRESSLRLRRGSWMVVMSASSYRSVSYMIESVRGIMTPVRFGTWVKPVVRSKVRTAGWGWASVIAVAMRRGPKNRKDLVEPCGMDWIESSVVTNGRRAQLPQNVSDWAVMPYVVPGGVFLDPFAGSGALMLSAERSGMDAHGFEINPELHNGKFARGEGGG